MPAMRFSQIQEFPFGRYSDFTTVRALCAADKGRCCGFARNPLCRLSIFFRLVFVLIALQYKTGVA
jgi:hypothetical protein